MWPDNETTQDLLGFKVHADLIRSIVTNPKMLPVTIGIFGDWGSGKTSVMKILERDLNPDNYKDNPGEKGKYERIACIYFNGWMFEGYDDAKSAILSSVLLQLGEHKRFGPKIHDDIIYLLKSVNLMRVVRLGFEHVALPAILAYSTGGSSLIPSLLSSISKVLGRKIPEEEKDEEQSEDTENDQENKVILDDLIKSDKTPSDPLNVRSFRDQFLEIIKKCNINSLVVLIDDLDRCSPERIIDNLEAIKLFLNVERTAFVIGADPRIVRHAIATRYKSVEIEDQEGDKDAGRRLVTDYLEKLIQVPYYLPRLSPAEVETYMTLLFCNLDLDPDSFRECLSECEKQRNQNRYSVFSYGNVKAVLKEDQIPAPLSQSLVFCAYSAPLITECLKGNPRQVKRFLNAFVVRKNLAEVANLHYIRDDVLVKLMVLEYGHPQEFLKLHEWQSTQEGFPKEIQQLEDSICDGTIDKEKIEAITNKQWSTTSLSFMQKWITMEPLISDIDLRDYFWISRDRLQPTFSGVSMVSPIVRRLLEDLISGNSGKMSSASKETKNLNEEELSDLLMLLKGRILQHPDQKNIYDALRVLIEEHTQRAAEVLAECLSECSAEFIPPAVVIDVSNLIQKQPDLKIVFQSAIDKIRQTKTKAGAALEGAKL
jgi:hypothetical protein